MDTRADQEVCCMKGNQAGLFTVASEEGTGEMGVRCFRMAVCFCFKTGSCYCCSGLILNTQPRLALNS